MFVIGRPTVEEGCTLFDEHPQLLRIRILRHRIWNPSERRMERNEQPSRLFRSDRAQEHTLIPPVKMNVFMTFTGTARNAQTTDAMWLVWMFTASSLFTLESNCFITLNKE
jgi:hypothetical protein